MGVLRGKLHHWAWVGLLLVASCRAEVPQFDALKLGESYSGVVAIGDHAANKQVMLPAGLWRLIQKGEGKTGPVQGGREDGRQFKLQDLVLVQTAGPTLKALLYVHGSAEIASVNWLDEPCKRTNTLYRNAFDSSPWIQSCLLVNHLVGPLTLPGSTRQALKNIGVVLPAAVLSSQLTRYQRGGFLQLRVMTNPAVWGIVSQPQTWSASAWHKDHIAEDPARLAFARQWQQWSEAYAGLLDHEFKGEVMPADGKVDEFPAFTYVPL